MKAAQEARNQLTEVPDPPENCSEREAKHFTSIARTKLENGELFEDEIEKICDLAAMEVWRENIIDKRKRLLTILKLNNNSPDPDLSLKDPEKFAGRVDYYLTNRDVTVKEAYQLAEEDHKTVFGERKYSSYDSYRNARRERELKK